MIVDRSARGRLRLGGAEAAEFLQGQVTNDVESLAPGQGCYAALLNHKGKMRLDMRVLRGPDWIWIDTEPGADEALLRTVETYSLGRAVTWERADERIVSVIGDDHALEALPPAEEHAWVEGPRGIYVRTYAGVDIIGHDLPDATAGEEDAERVRIERGIPRFGYEMDGDTIPQEAGLNERAVSFTKGCYVGQETVARLYYKGKPNRHLRGLRLAEPVDRGEPIRLGEREVGRVGSTTVSPTLGPIALAIVRREAAPGDTVQVNGTTAELVELPFER
ncbi:MAG TPA: glycine cleavage T C-terminal barrel domain-containing protein [Thermoleophilaceae bacterium]|nr:glycine cleavage T C-terminal barrel domain-containing protein [Thermoleophilaceae bacterium]